MDGTALSIKIVTTSIQKKSPQLPVQHGNFILQHMESMHEAPQEESDRIFMQAFFEA